MSGRNVYQLPRHDSPLMGCEILFDGASIRPEWGVIVDRFQREETGLCLDGDWLKKFRRVDAHAYVIFQLPSWSSDVYGSELVVRQDGREVVRGFRVDIDSHRDEEILDQHGHSRLRHVDYRVHIVEPECVSLTYSDHPRPPRFRECRTCGTKTCTECGKEHAL